MGGVLEPRGNAKASSVILRIHGKAPVDHVVWEWLDIATPMRERGYAVICPNLHSCAKTAPATCTDEDALAALREIVKWARERHADATLTVYGKSWGGARAVELAAAEG